MSNRKGRSQYASPLWLQSLEPGTTGISLQRLPFSSEKGVAGPQYDEAWQFREQFTYLSADSENELSKLSPEFRPGIPKPGLNPPARPSTAAKQTEARA
jgi:hypothetical protein